MSYQVIKPLTAPTPLAERQRIDYLAEQYRIGWKGALKVMERIAGKTSGLTQSEARRVIKSIQEQGYRK